MPRSRNIKPGLYTNERLVTISFAARYMAAGLPCWSDREGRLEDRPVKLKMQMFPADNIDTDELLNELAGAGFIERYEIDNIKYIQIVNFEKHQNPHCKEIESTIQAPCKNSTCTGVEVKGIRLKESVTRTRAAKTSFLDTLELPDFVDPEVWADFVQMRKKIKKQLTPTAVKQIFKDMTAWKAEGDDPNQSLLNSIRGSWQGVFKPQESNYGTRQQIHDRKFTETPADRNAKATAEYFAKIDGETVAADG